MIFLNHNLSNAEFVNCTSYIEKHVTKNAPDTIKTLFIRLSNLSTESRWELRKAINNNPNTFLVLLSTNASVARFAWKIQTLQFISYPITKRQLNLICRKLDYYYRVRRDEQKLRINFSGGFHMIDPNDISVIQGQGSYCRIFLANDKSLFPTVRISPMAQRLTGYSNLVRINKSLIINVNLLKKIEGETAYFIGQPNIQLQLSRRVIGAIKKELLWL